MTVGQYGSHSLDGTQWEVESKSVNNFHVRRVHLATGEVRRRVRAASANEAGRLAAESAYWQGRQDEAQLNLRHATAAAETASSWTSAAVAVEDHPEEPNLEPENGTTENA